jgi:hypothetical protein
MYNPQKPTKWGLHVYVIADSTNGYYGSTTTRSLMHPELTFTSRIVLELMSKAQNITHEKVYHPYTDRFYTNLHLAGRRETFYCDTCPRKPGLHCNKCFAIYHSKEIPLGM